MCDYSLHGIRNRLAEDGETLVIHRFYSGSKGLSSPEYLEPIEKSKSLRAIIRKMFGSPSRECAVCIPDGATVLLHGISPALQQARGLCATEPATFRQMSADPSTYRDALEFRNGAKVRLQELEEGQSVQVLALSPRLLLDTTERWTGVPGVFNDSLEHTQSERDPVLSSSRSNR